MSNSLRASVSLRVPFHDVDPAMIVWHGRYFKYFEQARCKLLEAIGYSYDDMAASGYVWPVVDFKVRFVKPIGYNDAITIQAELVEWEYRLRFRYTIFDANGVLLTRASSDQVPLDQQTRELHLGAPDVLVRRLEAMIPPGANDKTS